MSTVLHLLDQRRLIGPGGSTVSGSIYFYYTGTTNLAPIYQDSGMVVPSPNPVVVAAGEAIPNIYLDESITYRRRIVYSDGSSDDQDPLGSLFTSSDIGLPVGSVLDYSGSTAPDGFMLCYGQEISRADFAELFGAIGTTYGSGNGSTTFNLPDFRGRVLAGKDNMGGSAAGRLATTISGTTLGAVGGSETHTLTSAEMPSHSHTLNDPGHSHTYSQTQNTGGVFIDPGTGVVNVTVNTSSATTGITANSTGGGGAHTNLQPSIIVNKIIKVTPITFLTLIGLDLDFTGKAQAAALGVNPPDNNMGTYTGSIITDSQSAKQNIQQLETAIESLAINLANPPYNVTDGSNITSAWNTAAATGKTIIIPKGSYTGTGLTSGAAGQTFIGLGNVTISKSANGALFTSAHDYLRFEGIVFDGSGFTGDNISITGNHPILLNCGSQNAAGRAAKLGGSHVQIIGSKTIYHTTDATATGFDLEIGTDGVGTRYHLLLGVYSSQATGGIKLIDTGSAQIVGGQFGKLSIVKGSGGFVAGSNGGTCTGSRINGDVFVSQSNSSFDAVQFDSSSTDFVFDTGTSGGAIGPTCSIPLTYTNNGTATGASANRNWSIGTSNIGDLNVEDLEATGDVTIANNKSVRFRDSGGVVRNLVSFSSGDDLTIGTDVQAGNFTLVNGGSGGTYIGVSGTSITQTTATTYLPVTTDTISLGTSSNRWTNIFLRSGGIVNFGNGDVTLTHSTGFLTLTKQLNVQVLGRGAPVTKTADFSVAATESWLINNKAGSACIVTLPAAASFSGREIMIKNIQAQTVDSASSNVVPLAGGAAGTAILSANAGRWATLVSDGTNWIIMNGVI